MKQKQPYIYIYFYYLNINSMLKNFIFLFLLTACLSCGSKRNFVMTDEFVNKELGIKDPVTIEGKTSSLSAKDKEYLAEELDVNKSEITNTELYSFIKKWEGTKYTQGGNSLKGVDSSNLIARLSSEVYGKTLRGSADNMVLNKNLYLFKAEDKLKEGDLVFFRLGSDKEITHVGIYLKNNRFFSCSANGGAKILNFKKNPWNAGYATAGRFQE